jgi:hypothetical protein
MYKAVVFMGARNLFCEHFLRLDFLGGNWDIGASTFSGTHLSTSISNYEVDHTQSLIVRGT